MPKTTPTKRGSRSASGGYNPERTRKALIDEALKLFGVQGYADTSVNEITEAAGVTKGAFYHHFDSKESLLKVIHDEFLDYQMVLLKEALDTDEDPDARLRELLRSLLVSTVRYQANVTVFYLERRHLSGERYKQMRRKRDEFDRLFLKVIERGIDEGFFRGDLDPHMVAFGILGMCAYTNQWYRPRGKFKPDQIADIFGELVLSGLMVTAPDRA